MSREAESIIRLALRKEPTAVEAEFNNAIKPHITREIEVKRAEVGSNLFAQPSEE